MKLKLAITTLISLYFLFVSGCSGFKYEDRVKGYDDVKVCTVLGEYEFVEHEEGIRITLNEISKRSIDKDRCEELANGEYERISKARKLTLCQHLAAYHHKGDYQGFSKMLEEIKDKGYADEECQTMADFYFIRLTRKQEKARAIGNALSAAAESMRKSNEQLYGRGSALNPVHIKID